MTEKRPFQYTYFLMKQDNDLIVRLKLVINRLREVVIGSDDILRLENGLYSTKCEIPHSHFFGAYLSIQDLRVARPPSKIL